MNDPVHITDPVNSVPNNIGDELEDKPFTITSEHSEGSPSGNDATTGRIIFSFVESLIDKGCEKFELERVQVYLGLALLSAVIFNIFLIYSSWSHYSPIILSFSEKEQRDQRARRLSEKEKEAQKKTE